MAVHDNASPAMAPDDGWLLVTVGLPGGPDGGRDDQVRGLLLQVLEEWLATHHRVPALLPSTRGRRNSDAVTVAFRADEAESALAFRGFCSGLGVVPRLTQSRVLPNNCPRTTPRQRTP